MVLLQRKLHILVWLMGAMLVATTLSAQTSGAKQGPLASDRNAVNSACSNEAATAGCGNETVGHGLLKCIHAYKRAHREFKISPGCRAAMKQLRADKRARKAARANTRKSTLPPQ